MLLQLSDIFDRSEIHIRVDKSMFGEGKPSRRVPFFGYLLRYKRLDLFLIPCNLPGTLVPPRAGFSDAVNRLASEIGIVKPQLVELLIAQGKLWIDGL